VVGNPNSKVLIPDYGCQIIAYRFYDSDEALADYEEMFKLHKTAFVLLSRAIKYGKK
jgi:hypothetical protein